MDKKKFEKEVTEKLNDLYFSIESIINKVLYASIRFDKLDKEVKKVSTTEMKKSIVLHPSGEVFIPKNKVLDQLKKLQNRLPGEDHKKEVTRLIDTIIQL